MTLYCCFFFLHDYNYCELGFTQRILLSAGIISSFNQSSPAVALHENMTFECEGIGKTPSAGESQAYWKINDTTWYNLENVDGLVSLNVLNRTTRMWSMTLNVQASETNNNTKVSCFIDSTTENRFLIIAGK